MSIEVHFVVCLRMMDLINAQKMEHTKNNDYKFRHAYPAFRSRGTTLLSLAGIFIKFHMLVVYEYVEKI
jgi:hypothetical protein